MLRLVDIIGVDPAWQVRHRVQTLARDGKSRVVADLEDLKKYHRDDYKKIMRAIKLVAENDRVENENYVKPGVTFKDVYELRAWKGHARLFFFYTPDQHEIVVCTNYYWKTLKARDKGQDAAFERCEKFRLEYLKSLGPK